ncbi:type II toxin-antitoxin system RelE/ParE family toxin [Shewanella oneidensis]|uniref:type II toxin-antitoxin system RelE/ParE family toxin n=2 Tax=Shewanella oneidensis TaxID=70863 RepID=UPI00237AF4C0|nr:type II toxin-antitoxin system RelE/ParE family toxin [Shewanella oneidensis]MDX5999828.1 type II toxin-antitoxin system RelE/ParE family toxin [Shewanella oneidensis]
MTLAQWRATQSKTYLSGLKQTIQLLAETPTLGKNRPKVRMNVFSFPYSRHVIYYIQHERLCFLNRVSEQHSHHCSNIKLHSGFQAYLAQSACSKP